MRGCFLVTSSEAAELLQRYTAYAKNVEIHLFLAIFFSDSMMNYVSMKIHEAKALKDVSARDSYGIS